MTPPVEITADDLIARVASREPTSNRTVVAIAGPPAAGKSTLAAQIHEALPVRTAIVGLDAFHFDDEILEARGDRARKGAPHTFDVDGYRRCLQTLIDQRGRDIAVPVFDRRLELSRNAARLVPASADVVVTEGNYLLIDEDPWRALDGLFDHTVFLDPPLDVVRSRIMDRWLGLGLSESAAAARADDNDLPNARFVLEHSRAGDYVIR